MSNIDCSSPGMGLAYKNRRLILHEICMHLDTKSHFVVIENKKKPSFQLSCKFFSFVWKGKKMLLIEI